MSDPFRCSSTSVALGEPLAGTASTVRAFLLLEVPGAWGADAPADSRLPAQTAADLEWRCAAAGVRPVLIRRHGRVAAGPMRCFAAYADPLRPRMETTTLERAEDLSGLPLERLGRGEPTGLEPHPEPVFLVCTHGRHDVCCAERGRPVAAALSASHPAQTWECSHIGGDRFAGNLLVLPDGLYYGRADRESGPRIAKMHQEGQVDLDHLRGRAGFGFPTQAAEWHLRRTLGLTGVDQLRLIRQGVRSDVTEAVFAVDDDQRWQVRIRTSRGEPCQLTCRVTRRRQPPRFELLGIEAVPG
ncbi:MAG TPA: sucrase ferredoxin [Nocardioidaceae bacterium]|nr:sucrase ferredoxin [Nocardioidaceae bacterium]